MELGQEHQWLAYFLMALGMAEYRNGHYADAEQTLLAAADRALPPSPRQPVLGLQASLVFTVQ